MTKIPEFKQMEIDKLRAELDHCRNSLVTAIDTSNHWSDAHATAYARGYAAGVEQAAEVCDERMRNEIDTRPAQHINYPRLNEAADCAAAIRALAAPPAAGS